MAFTVKIEGLDKLRQRLLQLKAQSKPAINKALSKYGGNVVKEAKTLAPVNNGRLRQSIGFKLIENGVEITVNVNYAAYVEFGTRALASSYVSSLPTEWQQFAATFKGKGGGSFDEFILSIIEWVKDKGIAGTYSVKTRRRTGNSATRDVQNEQAAYAIALSILRKGIKPQPYLKPAVDMYLDKVPDYIKEELNKI